MTGTFKKFVMGQKPSILQKIPQADKPSFNDNKTVGIIYLPEPTAPDEPELDSADHAFRIMPSYQQQAFQQRAQGVTVEPEVKDESPNDTETKLAQLLVMRHGNMASPPDISKAVLEHNQSLIPGQHSDQARAVQVIWAYRDLQPAPSSSDDTLLKDMAARIYTQKGCTADFDTIKLVAGNSFNPDLLNVAYQTFCYENSQALRRNPYTPGEVKAASYLYKNKGHTATRLDVETAAGARHDAVNIRSAYSDMLSYSGYYPLPDEFQDLADNFCRDRFVLDLCAGDGRMSRTAMERHAVDVNTSRMGNVRGLTTSIRDNKTTAIRGEYQTFQIVEDYECIVINPPYDSPHNFDDWFATTVLMAIPIMSCIPKTWFERIRADCDEVKTVKVNLDARAPHHTDDARPINLVLCVYPKTNKMVKFVK